MKPESVQVQLDRPLAGRLIGWGALIAALVAAVMFASSLVELRSAQSLSAGASPEDEAPVVAAVVPEAAAPVALVDDNAVAGTCQTLSDSGNFRITESGSLTVPGFDGAGTLDSVSVATSVTLQTRGSFDNVLVSPFPFTIFTNTDFAASISGPGGVGSSATGFFGPFTQTIPAETSVELEIDGLLASNPAQSAPVADYISSDNLSFPVTSGGTFLLSAGGDADASIRTTVFASVSVTYCSTPAPSPEITVSNAVEPAGAPDVGSFSFTVDCGGALVNFTLNAGEAVVLPLEGVADDANCTVTETIAEPGRWAPAVNGVCGNVIVIPATGRADFVNRLADPYGPCPTL